MQKIKLKTKSGKEVNAFIRQRDYKKIYGFKNRRKSLIQRIIKKLRREGGLNVTKIRSRYFQAKAGN